MKCWIVLLYNTQVNFSFDFDQKIKVIYHYLNNRFPLFRSNYR